MSRTRAALMLVVLAALAGCVDNDERILRDKLANWMDQLDAISTIQTEADAVFYKKYRKVELDAKRDKIDKRWQGYANNLDKKEKKNLEGFNEAFSRYMKSGVLENPITIYDPPGDGGVRKEHIIKLGSGLVAFIKECKSLRDVVKKEADRMEAMPGKLVARRVAEMQAAGDPNPDVSVAKDYPTMSEVGSSVRGLEKMIGVQSQ